ncbi:MAG: hypothetical protein OEZ58_22230, partial [Gammaproteobacteria bacterium]|nr:hypothetical protein [Gammaproteobacteria bacterium]
LINWTKLDVSTGVSESSVLFANGQFTAFSNGMSTLNSVDTITWTQGNNWMMDYDFSNYFPLENYSGDIFYVFNLANYSVMIHDGTNYLGDVLGSGLIVKGTSADSLELLAPNLSGPFSIIPMGSKYLAINRITGLVASRVAY